MTLTVGSGAIFSSSTGTNVLTINGGGTLALGSEAVFNTLPGSGSATLNLNDVMSGTNITYAGNSTVNLPLITNNFGSGQTTLAGPTLTLGSSMPSEQGP